MKLGIVIILIGIAWCVRYYLLRPAPSELPVATQQQRSLSFSEGGSGILDLPAYHPGVVYLSLPDSPETGETIEYIHWSKPDGPSVIGGYRYPGGGRHSRLREVFTFSGKEWVETDRYPRD